MCSNWKILGKLQSLLTVVVISAAWMTFRAFPACKAKVMTIRTVWKDLMEPLKAGLGFAAMVHESWVMRQSMTAFLERKRLKSRSNVTTPCKISSEKPVLASVSLWHMQGHDQIALENWKQRWLNICFFLCVWCVLHGDGFLMVFAASLNLMICTATICNSFGDVLGFHGVPIVLDQPRFLRWRRRNRIPSGDCHPQRRSPSPWWSWEVFGARVTWPFTEYWSFRSSRNVNVVKPRIFSPRKMVKPTMPTGERTKNTIYHFGSLWGWFIGCTIVKCYPGNRWKWSKQLFSKKNCKKKLYQNLCPNKICKKTIVPEPVPKQKL